MKNIFVKYFKDAEKHKNADPNNFDLQHFTDQWIYSHRNAIRVAGINAKSLRNSIKMSRKKCSNIHHNDDIYHSGACSYCDKTKLQ